MTNLVQNVQLTAQDDTSVVEKKVEFLKTRIHDQILGFEKRRVQNRNRTFFLSTCSVLAGATVTVLLGLKIAGGEQLFATIGLILSAIVTILNAFEGLFGYRRLWVQYTSTTNELRALRDELDYLYLNTPTNIPVDKIDQIYSRYSLLLKSTNSTWASERQDQDLKSTKT